MHRPFTVVKKMQAAAEASYQDKIKQLQDSLSETQSKISDLQKNKQPGQRFIPSRRSNRRRWRTIASRRRA